jgi:hypothetical protein
MRTGTPTAVATGTPAAGAVLGTTSTPTPSMLVAAASLTAPSAASAGQPIDVVWTLGNALDPAQTIAMHYVGGNSSRPPTTQVVADAAAGVAHFTAPTDTSAVVFRLLGGRGQVIASSGLTSIVAAAPVLPPSCAVAEQPRQVAPEMYQSVTLPGEQYYESTFDCFWVAGSVVLSADAAGQHPFASDDSVSLEVVRSDGTTASWFFDFSSSCTTINDSPPLDVSEYFQPGVNRVTIRLNDGCGTAEGNAPLYFSTTAHVEAQAEPVERSEP